jgi:hypothetical protein
VLLIEGALDRRESRHDEMASRALGGWMECIEMDKTGVSFDRETS